MDNGKTTLSPIDVYVPVSTAHEFPIDSNDTFLLNKDKEKSIGIKQSNCPFFTELTNRDFGENMETHWLKEQKQQYVLSKEQLESIITESWQMGRRFQIHNYDSFGTPLALADYLKQILP